MRLYLAAPLFNDMERERNARFKALLESWGHDVYLPQEDGGIASELIGKGSDAATTRKTVFMGDMEAIRATDALVALLDGRAPDEGVCVELGYAYGIGKPCLGYLTDQRTLDRYGINLMVEGCVSGIARTEADLKDALALLSMGRL